MYNSDRISKLQQRRMDPSMVVGGLNEVYKYMDDSPAVKYAIGAMQPIDPEYTKNTYRESERVQNQLTKPLEDTGIDVEYSHQGSVTNDTHIKTHSDIDTLVVHSGFITVSPPKKGCNKIYRESYQ